MDVLRKYIKDESVDLCYIDPPFNSNRTYNQIYLNQGSEDRAQAQAFVDTWTWDTSAEEGLTEITTNDKNRFSIQTIKLIDGLEKVLGKSDLMAYLISMTLRIVEIQRVLKSTDSFYLHCDPTASHYLKLILDSIFCTKGGDFKNELIWCYGGYVHNKNSYNKKHDVIFFYTKTENYIFNSDEILDQLKESAVKKYRHKDEKGYYRIRGRNLKNSQFKGTTDLSSEIENKYPDLVYRQYLSFGKLPSDWFEMDFINQVSKERLGYQTQKPEALLERIIKASSNKGDLILDAYCGCGTTVAVAQKLKRKWIGIDITYQSISLILFRLERSYGKKIKESIELSGVPEDFESAVALANKKEDKTRKEFEKWCVLAYSDNKAMINEKKGKDSGIDGIAIMNDYKSESDNEIEIKEVYFSVKSDKKPHVNYIRDLHGTIQRDKAAFGIFITLYDPTKDMIDECKKLGHYQCNLIDKKYPIIKIVTVNDILKGDRLEIPISHQKDVIKKAVLKKDDSSQQKLDL